MWIYQQTTGKLFHTKQEYSEYLKNPIALCNLPCRAEGYSGRDYLTNNANIKGKNNPFAEGIKGYGPIPKGLWYVTAAINSDQLGPIAMRLVADKSTKTYGRCGFYLHGDNIQHTASEGCIVLPHDIRQEISLCDDKVLYVVE